MGWYVVPKSRGPSLASPTDGSHYPSQKFRRNDNISRKAQSSDNDNGWRQRFIQPSRYTSVVRNGVRSNVRRRCPLASDFPGLDGFSRRPTLSGCPRDRRENLSRGFPLSLPEVSETSRLCPRHWRHGQVVSFTRCITLHLGKASCPSWFRVEVTKSLIPLRSSLRARSESGSFGFACCGCGECRSLGQLPF